MRKLNLVPFVVLAGLILMLCIWKGYYGGYEGYEDAVPEYCGTGGYKLSSGAVNYMKQFGKDENMKSYRLYSPSDCNKMENGEYKSEFFIGLCMNKAKGINYTEKCGGLNSVSSNIPSECKINDAVLGKPIAGFTITLNKKQIKVDDNTVQLYTKNECDKLSGKFSPITNFKDNSSTEDEIKKMLEANDKDLGMCISDKMWYSVACVSETPPSAGSKIKDAVKGGIKDFLGI